MPGAARAYIDLTSGVCCCHQDPPCISTMGMIIGGSPTVKVNGLPAARMADTVMGFCGHTATIVSASSTVRANGRGKARLGDVHTGCFVGTIISGSGNVITGG